MWIGIGVVVWFDVDWWCGRWVGLKGGLRRRSMWTVGSARGRLVSVSQPPSFPDPKPSTQIRIPTLTHQGRAIVITGCDSGFGYDAAVELALNRGFTVYAGCLTEAGVAALGRLASEKKGRRVGEPGVSYAYACTYIRTTRSDWLIIHTRLLSHTHTQAS